MTTYLKKYYINTTEKVDVISVIHEANRTIRESKIDNGLLTIIVTDPGGALTILEPLSDIVEHFKQALEVFPGEGAKTLSKRKEPILVSPRIKGAMLGKSLHVPVENGKLVLGPREETVIVDFERHGKRREFCIQVMGDSPAAQQQAGRPGQQKPPAGRAAPPKKQPVQKR